MSTSTVIYEPKGRAREYAALACNIYRGCDHGCFYCYAPSATQRPRDYFYISTERPKFLQRLRSELRRKRGNGEQVTLCFTCDAYQQLDVEVGLTRETIRLLHQGGYSVAVLTKGGSRSLRDLDLFGPGDAMAATLTFLDDDRSRAWEPHAAMPSDRLQALRQFHEAGIETWASLEPVIDPATSLEIIRQTLDYIELYKVGKLNYHPRAQEIDWAEFATQAVDLLQALGVRYYIKNDLAVFLPPGYVKAVGYDPYASKPAAPRAQQATMF